jgi:hypothetical protein
MIAALDHPSLWVALMCAYSSLARAESTAFYYGPDLPRELLAVYDQVVVEPGQISDVTAASSSHAALVAYVSLGEVALTDPRAVESAWVLGHNAAWSSRVMDLTHGGYQRFVQERFDGLWRLGYRRFFLDTLDSFELASEDPQLRAAQLNALAQLIKELVQRHPEVRLLLNRGFELLPKIAAHVHGVVAESLFDRWDAARGAYVRVPDSDRTWLLTRLQEVRERYGVPVIAIDYRPAHERAGARETARKISALGVAPWVCTGNLMDVGVGPLEIMPRRVLVVSELEPLAPARWLAPVLEYLGYLPEYRTLASLPLLSQPSATLVGRYAGIISVLGTQDAGPPYQAWLLHQIRAGVRVAIFGTLGFPLTSSLAHELGVAAIKQPLPGVLPPQAPSWSTRDELIGFEAEPPLHALESIPLSVASSTVPHLEARLANGAIATVIATTRWGGLAQSHVFAPHGLHGERSWVLDPFAFLTSALALPRMPVPDLTTESGGRVAFFAIELQGAAQHARMRGRPLVSEALVQLLAAHPWPHALSRSDADRAALRQLIRLPGAHEDAIAAGSTALFTSLTELAPLYDRERPRAPIAADSSFLEGSAEAYAYERVLETLALTDTPRRLRPIALHYHASAASSPGGMDALATIYDVLAQTPLYVINIADYRARLRAFQEQVLARDLAGGFHVFGGDALRTLRVPEALGAIDLATSRGVVTVAPLQQGRYVTFSAGHPRSLSFSADARAQPHLVRANGRIERFVVESRAHVTFAAESLEPLVLDFGGLPPGAPCTLTLPSLTRHATSDARGRLQLALPLTATGAAKLTCGAR